MRCDYRSIVHSVLQHSTAGRISSLAARQPSPPVLLGSGGRASINSEPVCKELAGEMVCGHQGAQSLVMRQATTRLASNWCSRAWSDTALGRDTRGPSQERQTDSAQHDMISVVVEMCVW